MPEQIIEFLRPFAKMVAEELANLSQHQQQPKQVKSRVLSGYNGIMTILQCSKSKAVKIKNSGILDGAITKVSARKFLIDENKALECLSQRKGGRR